MKKLSLTIAIVLGIGLTTFADPNTGGGLFQRGAQPEGMLRNGGDVNTPMLPNHGLSDNQDAPLGTGIAVMTLLGAAYAYRQRKRQQ